MIGYIPDLPEDLIDLPIHKAPSGWAGLCESKGRSLRGARRRRRICPVEHSLLLLL